MKGISKSIVEKLYVSELARKPYDFYQLKYKRDDLGKINTFKEKTVENILNSIEKSRYQELSVFVSSFSIPLLSSVKAKKFTALFDQDSNRLLEFVKAGDFTSIEKEIGKKTIESMTIFFSDLDNLDIFEKTIKEIIFISLS
jgi:DNA ligase (NAD+)